MKKYQSLKIEVFAFDEDIITQSIGEFEEQKSGLDNVFEDVVW